MANFWISVGCLLVYFLGVFGATIMFFTIWPDVDNVDGLIFGLSWPISIPWVGLMLTGSILKVIVRNVRKFIVEVLSD